MTEVETTNGNGVAEAQIAPTEAKNDEQDQSQLKKKVIRQIEYYFGNYNLHRDTFMREQMGKNDAWFTMDTMLKFKRLASICSEPDTILNIVKENIQDLMEVDFENKKIRRKPSKLVPENNDEYKKLLNERTVYVKGFTQEENMDDIHEFLSDYGKIEGIQLRRFPNNKKFKGSLMATFFNQEDANKFIQAPMVYYGPNELQKMSRADFWKEKDQEKENHKLQKKLREETEEKKKQENDFKNLQFIKITGITDDTITHVDIKELLESCGLSIKFFDRMEKHGKEGYAVYSGDFDEEQVIKTIEENRGSLTNKIKGADITFGSVGEELEKIKEMYTSFRSRFSRDGKKGKGKFQKNRKHGNTRKSPRNKKITFGEEDGDGPATKKVKVEE